MLQMTAADLTEFLERDFPQAAQDVLIERVDAEETVVRMKLTERHLRPGRTVSGPSLFALADAAVYLAILARIGPVALAVTTNASIDFMRKPQPDIDLLATARILKLGRVLAVGDVLIRSENDGAPVARASLTYSIPPARNA